MKRLACSSLAVLLALALPAVAQTADLLSAPRVVCVPVSVSNCKSGAECETRPAFEREKAMPMTIDFARKLALIRDSGKEVEIGPILDDRIEGAVRRFSIREGDESRPPSLSLTLAPDGKLLGEARDGSRKFEAACAAPR
jgi:hypothetical protein